MDEKVQKYLTRLLTELHKRIPSIGGKTHTIGLDLESKYLVLWVWVGDVAQSVIFDEDYDNSTPEKIVEDIVESLKIAGYKL